MPTLAEMRAEWASQNEGVDPYESMSDRELADSIYERHYQHVMERSAFDERIGYQAGIGERTMRKLFGAGELDVGLLPGMAEAIGGPASREQMRQAAAAGIFETGSGFAGAGAAEIENYRQTFSPVRIAQQVLFPQADPALAAAQSGLEAGATDLAAAAADTMPRPDPNAGILEERMIGAARSAPIMGAAMATGVVGGPGAAAAAAGVGQYGLGFAEADRVDQELRAAGNPGLTVEQKRGFAASTAAVEGLMEFGPAKVALRAGTPILRRIFEVAGVDVPSEVATTILQQKLGESYDVNKPLTAEQWTKAISDTVIETTLLSGPTAVIGAGKDAALEPVRRRAREDELAAQRRAQQAADDDRFMDEDLGGMMDAAFGPRPNQPPGSPGAPAGLPPPEDPARAAGIQPDSFEASVLKTPKAQRLFGEWRQARAKIEQAMAVFNAMPKGSPEAARFYNSTILPLEERAWAIDNDELATEVMGKPIDPVNRKPKPTAMKADPAYRARRPQPSETTPQQAQPEPAPPAAAPPAAAPPAAQAAPEPSPGLEPRDTTDERSWGEDMDDETDIGARPGMDMDAEVAKLMAFPGEREGAAARIERLRGELLSQAGPPGAAPAAPEPPREPLPDIPVESEEAIAARLDQAKPGKASFRVTRPTFDQTKMQAELTEARELLKAAEHAREVAARKSTKPKQRKELLARAADAEDRIPSMIGSVRKKFGREAANVFSELVTGRRNETASMTIDLDGTPVRVTVERNGIGFSDDEHDSVHFDFNDLPEDYSETGYLSHFASIERGRDFTADELEAGAREILADRKVETAKRRRAKQAFERSEAKRKAKAAKNTAPGSGAAPGPEPAPAAAGQAPQGETLSALKKRRAALGKQIDALDPKRDDETYNELVQQFNDTADAIDKLEGKSKAEKPKKSRSPLSDYPSNFEAQAFTPVSVPCPACGVQIGARCKRPSGHGTADSHKERKELADHLFEEKYGKDAIIEYDVRADRWGVINPKTNEWLAHASKYGPHNQSDKPKKPKAPDKRGKRPAANPAKHDILEYLAAVGGVSWQEASKQGLDPADMRDAYALGFYRPFVKGAMSFDAAAEMLDEAGYPVQALVDGEMRYSVNKLLDVLDRALRGEKIYSTHNTTAFEELAAEREADSRRQEELAKQFDDLDAAAAGAVPDEWQVGLMARYKSETDDARAWAKEIERAEAVRLHATNRQMLEDAYKDGEQILVVQYLANLNALAEQFDLERADPKDYGLTNFPDHVAEGPAKYVAEDLDLFGAPLPKRREPRKPSTQTDLFGGTPESQQSTAIRIDLQKRQDEVDAKLSGDKSVPEDINNGDLFSRQIDLTDVKPAEVRRAEPVAGEIDVILPADAKPKLDERFAAIASKVGLSAYGVIDAPQKINDAMDLARIVKGILGNKPQEQFLVIVADKDRRPLAVIRHTIGLTDQSMVEPSMALGPAFEIDGAKKIYLAHQHPSGVPDPSQADEMITARIKLVLKGSGLEFDGHMVLGIGSDTATMFDDTGIWTRVQGITPAPESQKLALLERTFEIVRPPSGSPLLNPEKTAEFLERNDLDSGILFLDNRHQVVGFMHMTLEQMAKLKTDDTTSGMALVYRTIHQLNAKSMIAVTTAKRGESLDKMTQAMQNVGTLASYADTRMLDGLIRLNPPEVGGGWRHNMISMAERGTDLTHGRDLQANPIRELAKLYQKLVAKPLIDYWNQHVGWRYHPLKQLPDMNRFLNLRYRLLGRIDKVSRGIVRDVFDVFSAARNTPDEQAVFHFLTNRGVSPNVITNAEVRVKAMAVKRLFRQIGREWVRLGVLPASSVNSMADQYLPRLYLRHIMGNNAFAEFGSGRKPSKMGWRKRRSNIDQLTREIVLGEIKDPSFLAAVGLGTQLRDMHVLQFLHAISTNQNWIQPRSFATWGGMRVTPQWLASEAERIEEQSEFYLPADKRTAERMAAAMRALARLVAGRNTAIDPNLWRQLPDSPRYGHLRGAWVRKEIYDDLMGIDTILPPDASMVEQILSPSSVSGRISAWWKTTRVTLNPPTQVRNFMSNLILLHMSGVPAYRIYSGELIARVLHDRIAGGKYFRIAEKYGLFSTTFSAQELANVESEWLKIQLRMRRGGVRGSLAHARAIGEAVVKHAGNAYSMIEYLAKMAKVIDAMEREGMNEQDAMLEAQKWLFDYSLVPRTLRFLRNAPIGAPFLTFMYKAAPRVAEAALLRPWTLALYTAVIPYLTVMFYGMMFGDDKLTEEDVAAIKRLMPEWAQKRGNLLFLPFKDDEGRWQFLDLGFLLPWGMFSDASQIIQSPMPLGEKVNELRKTAGLGGGPILDPLVATMTGRDPFRGTPIANESDPPSMQAAAYMSYMANVWIPPWLHGLAGGETKGHAANIVAAATGENVNYRTHEPSRTVAQATAAMFGLTTVPVSEHHSSAQLLRQLDYEIRQVEQRRTQAIRNAKSEKEREDIKQLYRLEIQRRKDRIDEVNRAREALSKRKLLGRDMS